MARIGTPWGRIELRIDEEAGQMLDWLHTMTNNHNETILVDWLVDGMGHNHNEIVIDAAAVGAEAVDEEPS
jgi:hypothetical protein